MPISRRRFAVAVVPLVLATGIFACGGRVEENESTADAGPVPTGTTTPTGSSTGTTSPTATPTSTSTPPPDAGHGPGPLDAGSEFSLDIRECVSRPDTCHWPSGGSGEVVDGWLKNLVAGCAATPPSCGTMKMKFSRLPDFGGCGQSLTFSAAQPVDFILCLEKELSSQRCSTGLWVGMDADVDTRTIDLCPR